MTVGIYSGYDVVRSCDVNADAILTTQCRLNSTGSFGQRISLVPTVYVNYRDYKTAIIKTATTK